MPKNFFLRLHDYYLKVGEVLRGEAQAAAIFPNPSDIGTSREEVYAEFLKQHVPSKCNVFFGGFVFDQDGAESKQLDVIITTDTTPRFHFFKDKSFSPVEGTLGVASIKSTLDKAQLIDALEGIASIPLTRDISKICDISIPRYSDWPLKIVYASNGLSAQTILAHMVEFYKDNPEIPFDRRPNIIHVAGSYVFFRANGNDLIRRRSNGTDEYFATGVWVGHENQPDIQAINFVLTRLQARAAESSRILYRYEWIGNNVNRADSASNPS
jgi:hypothetical protein